MTICRLALLAVVLAQGGAEKMLNDDVPPLSRDPDVTAQGCSCNGRCSATLDVGLSACDWCWTTHRSCGKSGIQGSWDYCIYPKMVAWESLTHQQKEDKLWSDINAPDSVGKSDPMPPLFNSVTWALTESMITVFDDQWDVFPEGRTKVIHHQGVLCKFDLDVTSQSFTGVFASGKAQGIIRMGSATPTDSALGIHPGIAVKFLRSGVQSANFVALAADPTTENYNYFWRKLSNQVAPAKALQATGKFQQASGCINQVGLSDVCKYTQDGTAVASPVFPYEIQFEPAGVSFPNKKISPEELMHQLSSIPSGTHVFDVYTYSSPAAKKQDKREKFGTLTTTSKCVQSLYGDTKLFFRHQRMEEDFALMPAWIQDGTSDACQASNKPVSNWQCASPGKPMLASNVTDVIL